MAEASLITQLPMVLQYMQTISYIVMAYVFGAIVVRGWRGYLPWFIKYPAIFGAGGVCVISGVSLAPFFEPYITGILSIMQVDVLVAGVIAAVVFAVGLFLLSYTSPVTIKSLERQLDWLKKRLSRVRESKPNRAMQVAGAVIILGLVGVSLALFRGFPADMTSEMFESMGVPQEFTQMGPECMSTLTAAMSLSGEQLVNPPVYVNADLKAQIEAGANDTVVEMYRIDVDDQAVIIAMTKGNKQCFATLDEFCMCPPTGGLT